MSADGKTVAHAVRYPNKDFIQIAYPASEEQPDAKTFTNQLKQDARDAKRRLRIAWYAGMQHVRAARANVDLLDAHHAIARDDGKVDTTAERICSMAAFMVWSQKIDDQMRVPAPDKEALRWKQKAVKWGHKVDAAMREGMIALDVVRLG